MAGQDSDGGGSHRENVYVAYSEYVGFLALGESATRSLVRRSRGGRSAFYSKRFLRTHAHTHTRASTRPLILILVSCISLVYLCVVSLPLHDEVRAVLRTRAHTRIPAHAHAHTHAYAHLQLI